MKLGCVIAANRVRVKEVGQINKDRGWERVREELESMGQSSKEMWYKMYRRMVKRGWAWQ